jgi:F0F1-type ATP synthase assembly protein I
MPQDERDSDQCPRRQAWGTTMALASGGIILAGSVGVGAGIGWWLDQRWGTDPWLAVVGVLLGSAAGFTELWRMVQRSGDDD